MWPGKIAENGSWFALPLRKSLDIFFKWWNGPLALNNRSSDLSAIERSSVLIITTAPLCLHIFECQHTADLFKGTDQMKGVVHMPTIKIIRSTYLFRYFLPFIKFTKCLLWSLVFIQRRYERSFRFGTVMFAQWLLRVWRSWEARKTLLIKTKRKLASINEAYLHLHV